jgi:hypothetical protein
MVEVTDMKIIAKNYVKLWFWVDLISIVPFARISGAFSDVGAG